MPPSTISTLIDGLPLLTIEEFSSPPNYCRSQLSESDGIAMRRIDSVGLADVSSGIREIARICAAVVRIGGFSKANSHRMKEVVRSRKSRVFVLESVSKGLRHLLM